MAGLYIHIPFCRKYCPFCAFTVRKDHPDVHQIYLQGLNDEIQIQFDQLSSDLIPIQSIYIGGGTPSTLSLDEIDFLPSVQTLWAR